MTTWVKSHFIDPKHAMTAICVTSLSIGAIGFSMVLLSAIFAR
ncbi:hypothetical protein ACQ4WM_00605 [Janthinobacterium sp. RB2R34]